jgi:ABC-type Fe3+ transport system substrate-binding protein
VNNISKFFKNHEPGQRILPANTATENTKHQLRIDAGEVKNGKKNIYLQANSQAKNTAIKNFISNNGTHVNIATAQIDVEVPKEKQREETERVVAELEAGFKSKIG